MKKYLLLTAVACFFTAICATAQSTVKCQERVSKSGNSYENLWKKTAQRSATLKDDQMWWGFYTGSEETGSFGVLYPYEYDCAIFVKNSDKLLNKSTISGVRFLLYSKDNVSNVKIWMAKKLPASGSGEYDLRSQDVDISNVVDAKTGYNEILFDEPYTLTESDSGVYVGYQFTIDQISSEADQYPVVTVFNKRDSCGAFFRPGTDPRDHWMNTYDNGLSDLAMLALISNDRLSENNIQMDTIPDATTKINSDLPISLNIKNYGTMGAKSLVLNFNRDGKDVNQQVDLPEPLDRVYGCSKTVNVTVKSPSIAGLWKPNFKISKVNGGDNMGVDKASSPNTSILTLSKAGTRKTVMEEYTGTWCSWCPRGFVGMKKLKEMYGDSFIGIAVHYNDIMMNSDYYDQLTTICPDSYYPSCWVNRSYFGDPYMGESDEHHFYADKMFEKAQNVASEADVEANAEWKDDSTLTATSTTTFYYSNKENPYRIAYALLEDSVHGDSAHYVQANIYGYASMGEYWPDDDMKAYTTDSTKLYNLYFNEVARGIWDCLGIEGSVEGQIVADNPMIHSYSIKIPNTVQDKKNLKLVTMVLNTSNNEIVNATECVIDPKGTSDGITDMKDGKATISVNDGRLTVTCKGRARVDIYAVNGSLINTTNIEGNWEKGVGGLKGIYVIRVTSAQDGVTTRKISL
jgi:hypothetical protein